MSTIETVSRLFTRARQSTASMAVQVLSMALAVGMGVYGESLWQDRLQRQKTQQLITAIAGEIDKNARYLQHLTKIVAFQTREEVAAEVVSGGREQALRAAVDFFVQELDRGQTKLFWNSAVYRPEFSAVDIRCISLIDQIYRKYDIFLQRAELEVLPLFESLISARGNQGAAEIAANAFKTVSKVYAEQVSATNTYYFFQFKELIPEADKQALSPFFGSLKLEECDLRPPGDNTTSADNLNFAGWSIIYEEEYSPFWPTPGFSFEFAPRAGAKGTTD